MCFFLNTLTHIPAMLLLMWPSSWTLDFQYNTHKESQVNFVSEVLLWSKPFLVLVKTEVVICVWMQTKGWMSCCRCIRNMMLLLGLDSLPKHQKKEKPNWHWYFIMFGDQRLSHVFPLWLGGNNWFIFSFIYLKGQFKTHVCKMLWLSL